MTDAPFFPVKELHCDTCGKHIAWMVDAGPRGYIECDECHAKEAPPSDTPEDQP